MSHKPKTPIKEVPKSKPAPVNKKQLDQMIFEIQKLVLKDPHKAALVLKKLLKKAA